MRRGSGVFWFTVWACIAAIVFAYAPAAPAIASDWLHFECPQMSVPQADTGLRCKSVTYSEHYELLDEITRQLDEY